MSIYISKQEVENIIKQQLTGKLRKDYKFYGSDKNYFCPTVEYAKEVIELSSVDRYNWIKERFDCDDFALLLKADFAKCAYASNSLTASFCFGMIWGLLPESHVINWMINDDKKLRFIEPQTDEIYFPGSNHHNIWLIIV